MPTPASGTYPQPESHAAHVLREADKIEALKTYFKAYAISNRARNIISLNLFVA